MIAESETIVVDDRIVRDICSSKAPDFIERATKIGVAVAVGVREVVRLRRADSGSGMLALDLEGASWMAATPLRIIPLCTVLLTLAIDDHRPRVGLESKPLSLPSCFKDSPRRSANRGQSRGKPADRCSGCSLESLGRF